MKATEENIKCVKIKGELSYLGKHILLPMKVTLCGIPITGAEERFTSVLGENKFEIVDWDITCKRCIETFNLLPKN